jgi:hypothetical protein
MGFVNNQLNLKSIVNFSIIRLVMKQIVQYHPVNKKQSLTSLIQFVFCSVSLESFDGVENPPITSTRYVDESDPDIVYHSSMSAHSKKQDDVVTIGVHDLVLNDKCSVFDDENCEKVFVSVEFLNYPMEELETPLSLVKGEPNKKYSFNFQKGFFRRIFFISFFLNSFFLFKRFSNT